MAEIDNSIEQLRTLQQSYDQLAGDYAALQEAYNNKLQSIIDAHILRLNIDGVTFSGAVQNSIVGIMYNLGNILEIDDDVVTDISGPSNTNIVTSPIVKKVTLRSLKSFTIGLGGGNSRVVSSNSVEELNLPNLIMISSQNGIVSGSSLKILRVPSLVNPNTHYLIRGCPNVRVIDLSNLGENLIFVDDTYPNNLIDFIAGKNFHKSMTITNWTANEAIREDTTSLVEDGETFASNREKLLYNLREHMAANLPQLTTEGYSLNLGGNIKAAILADTQTLEAFTNKGWTIV